MRERLRDPHLGPAELELLRFVAARGPATVRVAADHFAEARGYGRTTVLKTMERLRAKGHLTREEVEGGNLYRCTMTSAELDAYVIEDFVHMRLGGSVTPLLTYLVERQELPPEEIERMRQLIEELDRREEGKS